MFSCCFSVAKQILKMKNHSVKLECGHRITVEAQPVQLVVPKQLEVEEPDRPSLVSVSGFTGLWSCRWTL